MNSEHLTSEWYECLIFLTGAIIPHPILVRFSHCHGNLNIFRNLPGYLSEYEDIFAEAGETEQDGGEDE